jgi:hypothetical protein
MPDGIFQPQAPNLLGMASGIEQIRAGRERRGLQREALGLQQQQFLAKQQQEREQAIAQQTQKNFDQAATLLKNAPTSEIAVRSARIMGDTLGIPIDEEKLVQNLKSVQKGIGDILKLSAAGQKEDALNLSTAILQQFSGTKGTERIPGLQKGLMEGIGETRERERIGDIFKGQEQAPFIPGHMEEGVSILPSEGLVEGTLPTGLPSLEEPTAPTGISKIEQQIKTSFGEPALKALQAGDVALFEKLKIAPKAPVIRDVNIGGGQVQTQGINPATGEVSFIVGEKFKRFKATKGVPFKEGQIEWFKLGKDPSTGKPALEDSIIVDTIDGKISKAKERSLKKQGFISKEATSIKLRLENPNQLDSLLSSLLGGLPGQQQVPQAPKGALTFEQFLKREQAKNPSVTRVDALEEYVRQIGAAE